VLKDLRLNQNLILHYPQLLELEQTMEFQLVVGYFLSLENLIMLSDRYLASFTIRSGSSRFGEEQI
jgi:hypothetical protein